MKEEFEKQYHRVEKEHWWFKARRNFILEWMNKFPRDLKVLDIGCSTGLLLQELLKKGFREENLFGVDISQKAINSCRKRGISNCFLMDAVELDFPENTFDIIIASDCLEHLEDEKKAIKSWHQVLKKKGVALIFVPAYQFLWSRHDEANIHFRRYTNKELRNKLRGQGFKIRKDGYWNFTLFFPVMAARFLGRLFNKGSRNEAGDLTFPSKIQNKLLTSLLIFENRLTRNIRFPFGVSTYCVAEA